MIRRHPLAVLIVVVLIAAAAWELPNYLRKGSLKTYPCGSSACEILVFVDQAPTRQTGIFYSKEDSHLALDVLDTLEGKQSEHHVSVISDNAINDRKAGNVVQ